MNKSKSENDTWDERTKEIRLGRVVQHVSRMPLTLFNIYLQEIIKKWNNNYKWKKRNSK